MKNLNGSIPILQIRNKKRLMILAKKYGMNDYSKLIETFALNKTLCEEPPTKSMELMCSYSKVMLEFGSKRIDEITYKSGDFLDYENTTFGYLLNQDAAAAIQTYLHGGPVKREGLSWKKIIPRTITEHSELVKKHSKNMFIKFFYDEQTPEDKFDWSSISIRPILTGELDEHVETYQNSDIVRQLSTSVQAINRVYQGMWNPLKKARFYLGNELPKIKTKFESIIKHYKELNEEHSGKFVHLSFIEQLQVRSEVFSKYDYRRTPMYYYHQFGHSNATQLDWSGYDDSNRMINLGDYNDIFRLIQCLICKTLKLNCCNETGCVTKGFPYLMVEDGVNCFYPRFTGPSESFSLFVQGFDPNNPMCENYASFYAWGQAFIWFFTFWWLPWLLVEYPNMQRYLSWFIPNLDGTLPPNIYYCLPITMFYGFVWFVAFGTFVFLFGFILNLIQRAEMFILQKGQGQTYFPNLTRLYRNTKQNLARVKFQIGKVVNNTRSRIGNIRSIVSSRIHV
jgi:hypothetical protein